MTFPCFAVRVALGETPYVEIVGSLKIAEDWLAFHQADELVVCGLVEMSERERVDYALLGYVEINRWDLARRAYIC